MGITEQEYQQILRNQAEAAAVVHGKTCRKVEHVPGKTGYLHDSADDEPYEDDNLLYCGRCHTFLRHARSDDDDRLESPIQAECVSFMEQDGWRSLRTDPVSDRRRGKGFGEIGMADHLFIRYEFRRQKEAIQRMCEEFGSSFGSESEDQLHAMAEVLWIEWKRPRGGVVSKSQLAWHNIERARGALTWIASVDFTATAEGFREHYAASGLMRRTAGAAPKDGPAPYVSLAVSDSIVIGSHGAVFLARVTERDLYEQFIRDTGQGGRALTWDELPQFVRDAWRNVLETSKTRSGSDEPEVRA